MRKILFSFLSVQGDPSRNEERAGKRGGGEERKKEDTAEKNREKGQKEKKYNWLKNAGFRVSGTEKEAYQRGKDKTIGYKRLKEGG
jgi:hypothetical protein